jgi:peptidoglycan/xylan/chitin deacetylase (PgdA/CDA1 family)
VHIVTLAFDDGIRDSCRRVAEIYERHGLAACFCVIALGHRRAVCRRDPYHRDAKGDFTLWNELQARGHEIAPHGLLHLDKSRMPQDRAQALVAECLRIFAGELAGFDARKAVFHFPFNASTPALEAWLPSQVRAFRTGGGGYNPLPRTDTVRLQGALSGPLTCEDDLEAELGELFRQPSGWLIYCAHGLDGQGWGPMRSAWLDDLLQRLLARGGVEILPAARVLELYGN